MRKSKRVGDWIAGFTSKKLCGDGVGKERLVYLMQVCRAIPMAKYYLLPEFQCKIPDLTTGGFLYHAGDNIYRPSTRCPTCPADFEQVRNPNHWDLENDTEDIETKEHDLSGVNVLLSETFWYFGRHAKQIPSDIRPKVPAGQSAQGSMTRDSSRVREFLDYVRSNFPEGISGPPHKWPRGDDSWRP